MSVIVLDARESGTSTGRYIDKLVAYLHVLQPPHQIVIMTKPARVSYFKNISPSFIVVESNVKEFTFAEQLKLPGQIRRLKPDLVHFGMTHQPLLYWGKSVTTVHDLTTARFINPAKNWFVLKLKQLVYRVVIVWAAHKSKLLITPSKFVRDDLADFAAASTSKITVTYEAADKISDKPTAVGGLQPRSFLLYVGRATPHKNLGRLVEAFEVIANNRPELKLVLAGQNDANYKKLQKLVADKNLTSQVIFTGRVTEGQLRWLYENTLVYIFPSLSEGFGLPGLEAMAHGAPVISSNATCLPEIYGEAAHYFNPMDVNDMAAKINEILVDEGLRHELIERGYKQVKKYSWQKMAEETLAVYNKVL